ncbi:hypothetical protein L596_002428 [Steinernema carpocapsae]|uniref:Uncharacterized protein n=1 Tax=Steinernema carpocapsae TaxID=34508 RepID=A0A4V6I7E4_STECR|nr:hypothetical protein L596_002428 [Steinernema carpocapsae]
MLQNVFRFARSSNFQGFRGLLASLEEEMVLHSQLFAFSRRHRVCHQRQVKDASEDRRSAATKVGAQDELVPILARRVLLAANAVLLRCLLAPTLIKIRSNERRACNWSENT